MSVNDHLATDAATAGVDADPAHPAHPAHPAEPGDAVEPDASTAVDGAVPSAVGGTTTTGARASRRRRARRKGRRGPVRTVKRWVVWAHRWTSMVLGVVLLVVTTTGAVVLYTPEWTRWTNAAVYDTVTTTATMAPERAIAIVAAAHPDFDPTSVQAEHGLMKVSSSDPVTHPGFWGVDPSTGRITGHADPSRGFMALMNQIHECLFTCKGLPAYQAWLNAPVPTLGMGWLVDVTWGGLLLGACALLLLFLGVSGIWLWWPTLSRFTHGFRVRWSKGRYARDYDLHQVIGMAAIPFLLMWGLTGANFEFRWVGTAFYAVTGGQAQPDTEFAAHPVGDDKPIDVGMAAAAAAAQARAGGAAALVYAAAPAVDDAAGYYTFWFARGLDPYRYGSSPGEYEVLVDRYDTTHLHIDDYGHEPTVSNQLLDGWGAGIFHYGQAVNGWWRLIWFTFGLTPLLLAVTGMSTWLAKRKVRKHRRQAAASRATPAAGDDRADGPDGRDEPADPDGPGVAAPAAAAFAVNTVHAVNTGVS